MADTSQLYDDVTNIQKHCGVLAVVFGLGATVLTAYWANNSHISDGFLGGLNWKEHTFSWHPVLMVTGTMLCLITALTSYRILPFSKPMQKNIHGIMHTAAVICLSIGLAAIFLAHNDLSHSSSGTYSDNFTSVHTFVGMAVFVLYGLNYIAGLFHFALPNVDAASNRLANAFLRTHVFLGSFILLLSLAAIETGLMLLTGSCGYNVSSSDTNPAQHYHLLSDGCQFANAIGIVVLLAVFLAFYSIFRFHSAAPHGAGVHK